jgi:predicted transcriptional regulator
MAHGSVVTLLIRLETKRLVTKKKGQVGKAFVYRVCQPRKAFRGLLRQLVQRVFHGDAMALVASLFESNAPTPDQVDKLQEIVDELRKNQSKERGR